MIKPITIKNLTIGTGQAKVCVPITGVSENDIMEQVKLIRGSDADLIEWRADYSENVLDTDKLIKMLEYITNELSGLPIIFTLRTTQEGGLIDIPPGDYCKMLYKVIDSQLVDIIDVQFLTGDDIVKQIISYAHETDVKVLLSNHEFQHTPGETEIVSRLLKMQKLDGDILKIAVMPKSKKDVITLLSATEDMVTNYADRPVITISMEKEGLISRIAGEFFGSCISFGSVEEISAPGQIDAEELKNLLSAIHKHYKRKNIFLIGFMGSGKTTVSHELSQMAGMEELDTDILIVQKEKKAITDIFSIYDEEYFRNKETEIIKEIIKNDNQVISCGGGLVLRDENVALMKENGTLVLLTAKPETILNRVKNSDERPILNGNMNVDYIRTLMRRREDRYLESADIIIKTDNKDITEICRELLLELEGINKK